MEAVIGVLIGGAISLVTTIVVDVLRSRRDRQHFLDTEFLRRVSEFVAAANDAIGKLHDRGVSHLRDGIDSPAFAHAKEEARDAVARVRVARSNLAILSASIDGPVNAFMARLDDLRDLAEEGFEKPEPRWTELRDDLATRIVAITAEVQRQMQP